MGFCRAKKRVALHLEIAHPMSHKLFNNTGCWGYWIDANFLGDAQCAKAITLRDTNFKVTFRA
jgi:hypothetical protein